MHFPLPSLAPHQLEGLQAILDEFAQAQRAQAHMACGSGKTRLGQAVAALTQGSQILVLVPSLPLLSQTLKSRVQL
jgi:superfamily II DNA or RNA helicase